MPLYEYECDACGHRFEKIQKFSNPPVDTCPKCGGHVHKMISSPAFHLKGTGWYVTDYGKGDSGGKSAGAKDKEGGSSEKSEKSDASDKSEKSEKSGEKKAAGKSESSPSGSDSASSGASTASPKPTSKE